MNSTSQSVYDELVARGIVVQHHLIGVSSFFTFTYNGKLRTMSGINADLTPSTARTICNNKDVTALIAGLLGLAMPATAVYTTLKDAATFLDTYKSIVVKPSDGAHGDGITINVTTESKLVQALDHARSHSHRGDVLLQQMVSGKDYRILVINAVAVAVAERTAASVIGDGLHTNAQLITIENKTNTSRGRNYEKALNYIDIAAARLFLGPNMLTVPEEGEYVSVVGTANIGTGGTSTNRTTEVPEKMIHDAERIVRQVGAFTCGVDFIYDTDKNTWYLIELNSSPSFGLHQTPSRGEPINVARCFVDNLLARYDAQILTNITK